MIGQLRTILILLLLAVAMIALGRMIGGLTAPDGPISENEVERLIKNLDEPVGNRIDAHRSRAVAGLLVPVTEEAHWPTVLDELQLARQYGVQSFIFQAHLPWQDEGWPMLDRLGEALAAVGGAEVWLALDVNPSAVWLDAHPDEKSTFVTEGTSYPSVGSAEWRNAGSTAVFQAGRELKAAFPNLAIAGVILRGLEEGQWYRTVGYDRSPSNTSAFQEWLERRYEAADHLSESWQTDGASFDEIQVPEPPIEPRGTFFRPTEDQRYIDYLDYLNETTANAVIFFADCAREAFGEHVQVYARYGASFEFPSPEHGQWALGTVLDGAVDGIALGVHRMNRSLGDVGGEAGPSTVPGLRGKRWILLDNTRTGIGWNATTNGVFTPAGFDIRTLSPIYDRNLLSAAMERGGVYWSDARGQGNFLDDSLWEYFVSRIPVVDELQNGIPDASRTVLMVLDEKSMRYVADGGRVGNDVLNATRSAVHQSGVSYGYVLLEDLLSGRAPEARVFVFPNLFYVNESVRDQIHAYLAEHGAAAVWLYAPGAAGAENSAQAVSDVVQMQIEVYDESMPSMSSFALSGNWIQEDEQFGRAELWEPLFYIDDEAADPIAHYADSNDASVAVKFMNEGWASVFIATPAVTPRLLREILDILDHPSIVRSSGSMRDQAFAIRGDYLLVHANGQGDRLLDFGEPHDIVDLLNAEVGWPGKQTLQISLRDGETRLLKLTPAPRNLDERLDAATTTEDPPESGEEVLQQP